MVNAYLAGIFLSTPSARRATYKLILSGTPVQFLSTPSARRATNLGEFLDKFPEISIHALREESDRPTSKPIKPEVISIHALREESDTRAAAEEILAVLFLSTPSARRATATGDYLTLKAEISIHALREESDRRSISYSIFCGRFLSTPSARRATRSDMAQAATIQFLSTPSARRATACVHGGRTMLMISIHALREESDAGWGLTFDAVNEFLSTPSARRATDRRSGSRGASLISIHALREESDGAVGRLSRRVGEFLSTPSARRATLREATGKLPASYFYPRPPRGERLNARGTSPHSSGFLSTPSARRATAGRVFQGFFVRYFYPRPPRGERPDEVKANNALIEISIHALREESDRAPKNGANSKRDFYPRPPRGERHDYFTSALPSPQFLSTPSARRATHKLYHTTYFNHAFLSTPSARRATRSSPSILTAAWISIHALREESDGAVLGAHTSGLNFYPRPPRGERPSTANA